MWIIKWCITYGLLTTYHISYHYQSSHPVLAPIFSKAPCHGKASERGLPWVETWPPRPRRNHPPASTAILVIFVVKRCDFRTPGSDSLEVPIPYIRPIFEAEISGNIPTKYGPKYGIVPPINRILEFPWYSDQTWSDYQVPSSKLTVRPW